MLHVSRRVNTGFSPRNKLAMKPGAKPSSTAISARARHVTGPGAAGDHQGTADRCPMRNLDCRFAPAHGFGMVAQREVRHCKRKVGVPIP